MRRERPVGTCAECGIVWNDPSYWSQAMKPTFHSAGGNRRFPRTDYCFHSGFSDWHSHWGNDDDRSEFHHFHSLSRELMMVCARERAKEMWVFGFVVAASAWPVIYMIVTVVELLLKGRPLNS